MIVAKAGDIDAKYLRLLARRSDGTPEAMAAEDARLRGLADRPTLLLPTHTNFSPSR